jgi:hypothetical protein
VAEGGGLPRPKDEAPLSPPDRPLVSRVHRAKPRQRLMPWPSYGAPTDLHKVANWSIYGAKLIAPRREPPIAT